MIRVKSLLFALLLLSSRIYAKDLSLSEILKIKTTVASLQESSVREAAGILTLITEDDIKKSGAKDIFEVLRMVPGFYYGIDTLGVLGIMSRGMWSAEGKVLLLVDGMEQNETIFGTVQIAARYPVDQIKQIEIIRGPGSAIYGGFAGLNVISIKTKKGTDLNRALVSVTAGEMKKTYGHNSIGLLVGKGGDDIEASVGTHLGRNNFTDRHYKYDMWNNTGPADLKTGSRQDVDYVNANIKFEGFEATILKDYYQTTNKTFWAPAMRDEDRIDFESKTLKLKKEFKLGSKIRLIPEYQFADQSPYNSPNRESDRYTFSSIRQNTRQKFAKLISHFDLSENFNIIVGVENKYRTAVDNYTTPTDPPTHYSEPNKNSNSENLTGIFFQVTAFNSLTLGLRHEVPENSEKATVPRLVYTKVFGNAHLKLLASQSFRSPTLGNLSLESKLKPEIITSYELESGYSFGDSSFLNLNLFVIKIRDPIAYTIDPLTEYEGYLNFNGISTRGLELEYRYLSSPASLYFNYSYYRKSEGNTKALTSIHKKNALLAQPNQQANLRIVTQPIERLYITPTIHYIGENQMVEYSDEIEDMVEFTKAQFTLVNLYTHYQDLLVEGLEIGVGATNLFDKAEEFGQPYGHVGWHSPYPGPTRQIYGKLAYESKF